MNLTELEVEDEDGQTYYFGVLPQPQTSIAVPGKFYGLQVKEWEPTDGSMPWRVAVHPWNAGLGPNRLNPRVTFSGDLKNRPSMIYAKANADASYSNKLVPPPRLNSYTPTAVLAYYNTAAQLYYGASYYGRVEYMGAGPSSSPILKAIKNFNGYAYFGGGQYLYKVDSNYTFSVVKDFGSGKTIYDIELYNNELIIAMGESEKIWKMVANETFTQATDATYAIALGQVDNKLWRAESKNMLSNCITAPLTLASWAPASPNQYPVGDTSYSITDILDYGGVPAVIRPDGVFFPDNETKFHNQTPQLARYPHADNGLGSFTAWGYLWVTGVSGLLRVAPGESLQVGPELSQRPGYRFWVRNGIDWNGDIYLVANDEAGVADTAVFKMSKDIKGLANDTPYIYHELVRLGGASKGYVTFIYLGATNPTLMVGYGTGLKYFKLGRGTGPDIDDSNYEFGTSFELESGVLVPVSDLGVEISLVGVKVVGKQPSGGSVSVQYRMDSTGSYKSMLTSQEGGGRTTITKSGYFSEMLYAPPNTTGNILELKIVGVEPANTLGTSRTEIYELWAFGESNSETTDLIQVTIDADRGARVNGLMQGRSAGDTVQLFRHWANESTILKIRIPDYEEEVTVRATVVDVQDENQNVMNQGGGQVLTSSTKVLFRRIDFADTYAGDVD